MDEKYAPLIIFGYARPDHLARCLDSAAENDLARLTELFLYCDGSKDGKDALKVAQVQKLAQEETRRSRFKHVTVIASERNKGLARSVIDGVTSVINQYGRGIVVEDDLVLSSHFLRFMNGALDYYQDQQDIWGVTGYTYPLQSLQTYQHDCYLSYRISSWGWGTWADRWDTVEWDVSDYHRLLFSPWRWAKLNRGGNDLFRMLRRQMQGKRNSWAIRFCYAQSRQNKFAVYPRTSLLKNEGFDGSGTHCTPNEKYLGTYMEMDKADFAFERLEPDRQILREFKSIYRITPKEAYQSVRGKLHELMQR